MLMAYSLFRLTQTPLVQKSTRDGPIAPTLLTEYVKENTLVTTVSLFWLLRLRAKGHSLVYKDVATMGLYQF